ncbi:histidine kinase [Zobellia sp. OII3]|uniref:sensor histidine kinase n=1 Tax=Zobellia sp. OII3 TaxID=2034520 RepID=UPI000B52C5E5|nr:HAMP domain-containing sensor histidine kinase [Zobellia sp. OII3]OWW25303.1 histidine kinase [Zobellia sp. OII3]
MHSLLQRQLRKKLPEHLAKDAQLQDFLAAVERSYENYDEKLSMIQRATTISSEELFEANRELTKEAARQQKILESLEDAIASLNVHFGDEEQTLGLRKTEFDAEKLAKHISHLAIEIAQITEEKTLLLNDVEAQNESLNNYVQMVSHDLKSPIRNVSALLSWVLDTDKENLSQESIGNIELASKNLIKMDNLINGILTHATIGKNMESKSNVDVNALLREVESNISIPENVSLRYKRNFPTIYIEKNLLEKVFTYLIENAIAATEHRDRGLVQIDFLDNDAYYEFAIADNGIGIPEKHQSSIFEMFKKLDNNDSSAGVGLALAQKIVRLYEGEIAVESKEDKGTTFSFTLKK